MPDEFREGFLEEGTFTHKSSAPSARHTPHGRVNTQICGLPEKPQNHTHTHTHTHTHKVSVYNLPGRRRWFVLSRSNPSFGSSSYEFGKAQQRAVCDMGGDDGGGDPYVADYLITR